MNFLKQKLFVFVAIFAIFLLVPFNKIQATSDYGSYLIKVDSHFQANNLETENINGFWKKTVINNESQLAELYSNSHILKIQKQIDYKVNDAPNDIYYNGNTDYTLGQLNLKKIGLSSTSGSSGWNISTGDNYTIVAVIDTGIDLTNPDLQGNLWVNSGEQGGIPCTVDYPPSPANCDDDHNGIGDDINGWNFYSNNNSVQDQLGHGTHVAGIIAADTNTLPANSPGIAGVCWHCKLMVLRVFGTVNLTDDVKIHNAIEYAVSKGAKVINLSLSGVGYSDYMQEAIDDAWNAGTLVVVASGNHNTNEQPDTSFYSPSGLDHVISVGATDNNDNIASFSNAGQRVDLTAPGVSILSTWLQSLGTQNCVSSNSYACLSGTSMSSPHVAGSAALLFDYHSTDLTPWTNIEVRNALLKNVDDITSSPGGIGFDTTFGFGRLNINSALQDNSVNSDNSFPVISLDSPAENYSKNHVTFTGSVSSNDLYIYHLKFEGPDTYLFSGRGNVSNNVLMDQDIDLSDGLYDVTLSAEDFNGNVSTVSPVQIYNDLVAPNNFSLVKQINLNTADISFSTTDNASGISHYEVSLNGGAFTTQTSPYTTPVLANGNYTIDVKAVDNVGNERIVTDSFTIFSRLYMLKSVGDLSGDGTVELSDLSILATYWNQHNDVGDINHDSFVDLSDLSILAQNWLHAF